MDAVSQANGIDETQLSKGHRKQPKKRTWKIETTWTLIQEKNERTQLIRDDTIGLHEFRDRSSVTRTLMCSLKVPTAASWRTGSCNLTIIRSLSETQMLRTWSFVVKEAR